MKACLVGAALTSALPLSGCATVSPDSVGLSYYWQSVRGHLQMLHAARPVPAWLADDHTDPVLRKRLQLAQRLRDFAVHQLALPDNASYRRYADLHRDAAVWNVVAAPELSLQLRTWCFPLLGCVGYRGYFDRTQAEALAQALRAQGEEASVYGVPAYSTLGRLPGGYFADPLLNTFIGWPEAELARLLFHELAHQVAYAPDDSGFNESFATAVERLGTEQWLASPLATPGAATVDAAVQSRRQDFRALVARYRDALATLYRSGAPDVDKRLQKAELFARMRQEHARLKAERWHGHTGYDRWMAEANNASLGVQAAYNARVETFERLFVAQGQSFPRFYAEVQRLASLPKAARDAALSVFDVPPQNEQRDGGAAALSPEASATMNLQR